MSRLVAEFQSLERVVLPPRAGTQPSPLPDVEIYLATGSNDERAERVFAWSVDRHRDPARGYRITLVREGGGALARVLELAKGSGRALYHEVGQIYRRDPAELFDQEMDGHALLVDARRETSPLLLDCERARGVWEGPRPGVSNAAALASALASPGLCRALDEAWSVRDENAPDSDAARLVGFRFGHTRPWRPHPERHVYHESALEPVFHEYEAEADAAGFELFGPDGPSRAFEDLYERVELDEGEAGEAKRERAGASEGDAYDASEIARLLSLTGSSSLVQSGDAAAVSEPVVSVSACDSVFELLSGSAQADALVCLDALDSLPARDLGWALRVLFARARRLLVLRVSAEAEGPHRAECWRHRVEAVAAGFPEVHWRLWMRPASGLKLDLEPHRLQGGRWPGEGPPRVWVLVDDRPGNATQSLGLADALGWPYEIKTLRCTRLSAFANRILGASIRGVDREASSPLESPWPDLVIAAGRRTAPVAQWIRLQNRGNTSLVVLGRKAGDAAECFDLAITPEYTRCMPHPRRVLTGGPLHRMTPEILEDAAKEWSNELKDESAPPRIALLVGGRSGQYRLDEAGARRMGEAAAGMVAETGGSLFVSTSRRTGEKAAAALIEAAGSASHLHRWSSQADRNPYRGYLACADAFVITVDSESMLSEACSTGKPVYIHPLSVRTSFRFLRFFRELVVRRAGLGAPGRRPVVRRQGRLARLCSMLIARGWVRPSRDLDLLRDSLVARGVAHPFGAAWDATTRQPSSEVEMAAVRVRGLMGVFDRDPAAARER